MMKSDNFNKETKVSSSRFEKKNNTNIAAHLA